MKIAVFGGTFNPPHKGHLRNAEEFAARLSLDKIIVIPTFIPPHKRAQMLAGGEDRLEMCRRTFVSDKYEISDMELKRQGKSYSYDTLCEVKKEYPDSELYLIIGSDMLLTFHEWYRYEDILKMCRLCVMTRDKSVGADEMKSYAGNILHLESNDIVISDQPALEISSTDIRKLIRSKGETNDFLTDGVISYIREKKLYSEYSVGELKEFLRSRLTEKRYIHSLGVADTAEKLAERYGVDKNRAYLAGLVHDITKNTPDEEQLQIIGNSGIMLTLEERNNPKLYHAVSGSAYIKDVLGFTDSEIISAVRYHTTGKAGMTTLEKIIYIADFVSPERDFPGVDFMRQLAFEDLDKACLFAVDFCIPNLVKTRCVLHPDSVGLYNELIIKRTEYRKEDANDRLGIS
ncbi:MAG: nicotinate (nicotinamide) nucleotide adenylyltransferase [Oscillospiraceae bacterium]|nr:nicotinate (nicotinamide) nucleotide adenylyltransferase [Oscillospiraceae bacterium]